ncbi:MAG: RNA polymerase subunit sigma-70 [Planctomycetaceae bacterium]|nr:RNA polymerase subunit sigma-70 [Planctomycetaceae bacterium]
MAAENPSALWIDQLKHGESVAANAVFERYFDRLVGHARQKLLGVSGGMADEEDVALSAFDSFCRAAQRGRFPDLKDRDGILRLLLRMTARKAIDLRRYELSRLKVQNEEALLEAIGDPKGPELIAIFDEEFRRLLDLLADKGLETLAVAKMQGFTNNEIAEKLDCSLRTVERQLQLIRLKWEQEQSG